MTRNHGEPGRGGVPDVIDQPEFGRRLRALRRKAERSQADLAGPDLSPSYVSLVEAGRRAPTPAVAQRLVAGLGMTMEEFERCGADEREERHERADRLLAARSAQEDGELEQAAEMLRALIRDIVDQEDAETLWEARWLLSEVLARADQPADRLAVLADLAASRLTTTSVARNARVHTYLCDAYRDVGKLGEAIGAGNDAVSAADALPAEAPERARALIALIAAHAESGDLAEAEKLAGQLEELTDVVSARQVRGEAHWAIGNVGYLSGSLQAAAAHHELAFKLIRPDTDVLQWARLCKGSATLALAAGGDPEQAGELLRQARVGLELVGRPIDLTELIAVEAAHRLAVGEPKEALELSGQALGAAQHMSAQDLARVHVTAARAHAKLGEDEPAADAYRAAGDLLEDAGLYQRAAAVWRELSELLARRP